MRKIFFLFAFLFLPLFLYAENIPQPQGWINDFAGVISSEYKDKLNSLISELEEKTSTEIAVVTVESISPYGENEYARLLFDNWKPGKKGKDNGVLVLLAVKERRWRIETGYGIEGILPDGLCGEIGREFMVPYFKENNYSEGLYQGALKIYQIITKDTSVDLKTPQGAKDKLPDGLIIPIILLIIFIIVFRFLLSPLYGDNKGINSRGNYWRSGGFGGGDFGGGGGFGGFGGGGGGGGGAGGGF